MLLYKLKKKKQEESALAPNSTGTFKSKQQQENEEIIKRISKEDFIKKVDNLEKQKMRELNYNFYYAIRALIKEKKLLNQDTFPSLEDQRIEVLKCKYDVVYWLENYCKVPISGAFIKILLNEKLKTVAKLFEASVPHIFQSSRQSLILAT